MTKAQETTALRDAVKQLQAAFLILPGWARRGCQNERTLDDIEAYAKRAGELLNGNS